MPVQMYLVGGYVRDKLLGKTSKDMDFAVEAPSFDAMREEVLRRNGTIFVEKPEYLTIRARVPKWGPADFVLCRRDGIYYDGRRPESVEPGTLMDDLSRRDFTMNAIAMTENGEYIDPHGGIEDINDGIIRCVGRTRERFDEDYLRMLRAMRFSITKGMYLNKSIVDCLHDPDMVARLKTISVERVREEMFKIFKHDTLEALKLLEHFDMIRDIVFGPVFALWLKPTLEL